MTTDPFWTRVADYLFLARRVETADQLIKFTQARFPDEQAEASGDAFFPGSGGNEQLLDSLDANPHFTITSTKADYHWRAVDKAGNRLTYLEGDLYLNP